MKNRVLLGLVAGTILMACGGSPSEPEPEPPQLLNESLIQIDLPVNVPSEVIIFYDTTLLDLKSRIFDIVEEVNNPNPRGGHPDWQWSATIGPGQATIKATTLKDNTVFWEITVNVPGQIGQEDLLLVTGTTSFDLRTGFWEFPDIVTSEIVASSSWSRSDQEVLTITTDVPEKVRSFQLVGKPDGSGSLGVESYGARIFEANWNNSGGGSWASYDSSGQRTGGGLWEG